MLNVDALKEKMRKDDRVLVLEPMGNPLTSTGLVDKRLFTRENNLHAILNPMTSLWHLRYDSGILPQPLKQQWTSFNKLYNFVEDYMKRRKVKVVKVID